MAITETDVSKNLEELYKRSRNSDGPLKSIIESANNAAEEEKYREIGKASVQNKGTVTQEQRDQIESATIEKVHSQTLQSLKGKADTALKTSGWEIFLEKGLSAVTALFTIFSGNITEGFQALKNGAGRAISELFAVIKEWKVGSTDHDFMSTLERHEKLRNLEKLASQELGITDAEERKKVVAQLAGEAPLPAEVRGGTAADNDPKNPTNVASASGGKTKSKTP